MIPVIAISQSGDVMTLYNIRNDFPNDQEYAVLTFTGGHFNMIVTLEEGGIVIG